MVNKEKDYPEEENLVWCDNILSTPEKNDMLYSLCRIIEKKSDEHILLSEYDNGNNSYTFVRSANNIYKANEKQSPLNQDDMIKLKYINNPTILYHLHERYKNEIYYTKMGSLLIYINPNKNINDSEEIISKYKYKSNIDKLNVNVYHISKIALNNLNTLKKSQSIIITGKSGSGKSEISKKIINFLSYNKDRKGLSLDTNIEENDISKILKLSGNIIDALGNSKTKNNNSSSRYVNFCKIYMNNENIKSFDIKIFLLNKELLTDREKNENSFNIFYYILNGSDETFKRKYFFKNIEDYKILINENIREKSDDEHKFSEFLESLKYIFDEEEINLIFSVLSALLLLGNIELKNHNNSIIKQFFICEIPANYIEIQKTLEEKFYDDQVKDNQKIILIVSKLLSIKPETLLNLFTKSNTRFYSSYRNAPNDIYIKKRIESLIKTFYEELFNWVLNKINSKGNMESVKKNDPNIQILDSIYFENLEENSLEELLINATNETIRNIYTNFFFKKPLNNYKLEEIKSKKLNYIDNENLYKTLIPKENSLFSFLENISMKKNFDEKNLCSSIIRSFHNSHYIKGLPKNNNKNFTIVHSYGEINYSVQNIIDKNLHILTCDFIEMFKKSDNTYLQQFYPDYNYNTNEAITEEKLRNSAQYRDTLLKKEYEYKNRVQITLLRNNLIELTKAIELTFCNFILCIKPNENIEDSYFNQKFILNQLNNFNILEIAQLKNGYFPHMISFSEFLEIFRFAHEGNEHVININSEKKTGDKENVEIILNHYNINPKDWCIGKNKIFLNEKSLKTLIYKHSKYKISEIVEKEDNANENHL